MAQYESKTDSKEFEAATAGQEASPLVKDISAEAADITIRLWRAERSESTASLTWKTDSVLVYMIVDLVLASRGQIADESSAIMTAHFDSSGQALVAAKRIQTSILEFLACRPGDYAGAAILIHPPPTSPTGLSGEMAQAALRLAELGQILLSEEMSRRLRDLPGIELRDVPALTTGGDLHVGLSQLAWISPERIAQLPRPAKEDTAQHRVESPPMGATMIVNAPFGSSPSATANRKVPVPGTGDVVPRERAETASRRATARFESSTVSRDSSENRDPALRERLGDFEEQPFLTRTRVIVGVVAIVLVGALVAVFYPSHVSKPPLRVPETPTVGAERPANPPGATVQPQPPPEQTVPQPPPKVPVVVTKPPVTPKPPVDKRAKDKDTKAQPEEPPPIVGFEGMTQGNIPQLLQWAKNDAGNGNYDKARKEYQVVLRLQPSNADAKEGLRKLDIAQSVNQ